MLNNRRSSAKLRKKKQKNKNENKKNKMRRDIRSVEFVAVGEDVFGVDLGIDDVVESIVFEELH